LRIAGQHAAASIISYSTNIFNVAGGLTAWLFQVHPMELLLLVEK
jgi:hypothetical protein